jgi:putative DNA-invertase from lambdoid prophage Rac
MNAAIYLRVSSKGGRQDESNQEPDVRRIADARGWSVPSGLVFREHESGAKDRPVWNACMDACRRGAAGALIVWAIDRVGRNRVKVAHDLGQLLGWSVRVVSVKESWLDTTDATIRPLLIQIMGWVAQGERDRTIERIQAGLARARAAGVRFGRPSKVPEDLSLALGLAWKRGGWQAVRDVPGVEGFSRSTLRTVAEREAARIK